MTSEIRFKKALRWVSVVLVTLTAGLWIYHEIGMRPAKTPREAVALRQLAPPVVPAPTPVPTELPCDVKLGLYDNHISVVSGANVSEEICTPRIAGVGWTIVPELEGQCVQILYNGHKPDEICRGVTTYNLLKIPRFRLKSLTGERVEVTIVTHRDGENWEYVLPRTNPV